MALLEIRTYRLKPGATGSFHSVVVEESIPLLERAGIDVVRFGPSEQREEGHEEYVLIRAFDSSEARDRQEAAFYSSTAWRDGPREEILSRIESFHTIVLTVVPEAVETLRRT
jgi:hypothetical protein